MAHDFVVDGEFDAGEFSTHVRNGVASAVIQPDGTFQYWSPWDSDAVWVFDAGGKRWAVLWKYKPIGYTNTIAIAVSSDNGATWSLCDSANAPLVSTVGPAPVRCDHSRPSSSATSITFAIRQDDGTYEDGGIWYYRICLGDFSLTTQTFGATYGAFEAAIGTFSYQQFAKRPDGTFIMVYQAWDAGTAAYLLRYRVWDGAWTQYDTAISLGNNANNIITHLAVDSAGRSHVLYVVAGSTYYLQIGADNSAASPEDISSSISGTLVRGNLAVSSDGKLIVPLLVLGTGFPVGILVGTPLSAPVFTAETISPSVNLADFLDRAWIQESDGRIAVYWPGSPEVGNLHIYKSIRSADGTWSEAEDVWNLPANPPDTTPPTTLCTNVYGLIVLPAAVASVARGWAVIGRGPASVKLGTGQGYAHCS